MATKIDQLLSLRSARLGEKTGDKRLARSRAHHTRFLAEHYAVFDYIRPHLFHPHDHPFVENPEAAAKVINYLCTQGWIAQTARNCWEISGGNELRSYLSGGWLEEYVFLAHEAAGVDEAYFGQEIYWEVDGVLGKNEVDVIARMDGLLSFTSCKAIRTEKTSAHMGQLRDFVTEADYWNIHFADDSGRALLVVTADLMDEMRKNASRYPPLLARATVLEVSLVGLEGIEWGSLQAALRNHWIK